MFDTYDQSRFLGRPIHLFVFTRGSLTYRFAGCDRDITVDGHTYTAAQIKRSEIKQTAEPAKDKLTVTLAYLRDPAAIAVPATQTLGDIWFPDTPTETVSIVCMAMHVGDTDPPAVEWMGQVVQPRYTDVELELECEPTASIERAFNQGPKWQRACWKTVYSTGIRGCNLAIDAYKVDATLSAVSGAVLTASAFATSTFNLNGGWIEWTGASGTRRATIIRHDGTEIAVLAGSAELVVGLSVTVRPGCEQNWAACDARGNTVNYGGAIYKPIKNPMDGVSMSWG